MRLVNQNGINEKDSIIFAGFKQKAYPGHKRLPTSLAWSKDGKYLATAQKYIRIWELQESGSLQKMGNDVKGHDTFVDDLKFYDNTMFGSMSRDILKFWDLRQGIQKATHQIKKTKDDFISLEWNHGSRPIYTLLTKDNGISMYDLREGAGNSTIKSIKASFDIYDIIWDNSDSVLLCAGIDNGHGILSMFTNELEYIPETLELHTAKIASMCLDKQNNFFATCSDDSLLHIYEMPEIACLRTYSSSESAFKKLSFNYSGQYLAVSSTQPYIDIYNAKKGGLAHRLKTSLNQENLQWHPNLMILAYIDEDQKRKGLADKSQETVKLFLA